MYKLPALLFLSVLVVFSITGCASRYGVRQTDVVYFPACYDPIQRLRDSESNVASSTVGGAALGAIGGAILGLITTGEAEGAIAGAAIGAAAGSVTGNVMARNRQAEEENRLMSQYLRDLEGDISELDIVSASARTSLQCYSRQFRSMITSFKRGRITRSQMQSMYNEIQSGTREAANLLGNAVYNGRQLERQYQQALYEQANPAPARRTTQGRATVSQTPRPSSASMRRAQRRTNDLSRRVDAIATEKNAAERQASAQDQEIMSLIQSTRA